jgi:hypothetical protein
LAVWLILVAILGLPCSVDGQSGVFWVSFWVDLVLWVGSLVDVGSNFVFAYFCGWAVCLMLVLEVAILGWPISVDGQSG